MEKALMVVKWGILQRRIIFWMVLKLLWEWIFWLILLFVYLNSDVMGLYSCKEFMRTRNRLSMSFFFPFYILNSKTINHSYSVWAATSSTSLYEPIKSEMFLGFFSTNTCFCVNNKGFHKNVLIPKYKKNVSQIKMGFGERGRNWERKISESQCDLLNTHKSKLAG